MTGVDLVDENGDYGHRHAQPDRHRRPSGAAQPHREARRRYIVHPDVEDLAGKVHRKFNAGNALKTGLRTPSTSAAIRSAFVGHEGTMAGISEIEGRTARRGRRARIPASRIRAPSGSVPSYASAAAVV